MNEIVTTAILVFVLTLIGLSVGFALLKVQGEQLLACLANKLQNEFYNYKNNKASVEILFFSYNNPYTYPKP